MRRPLRARALSSFAPPRADPRVVTDPPPADEYGAFYSGRPTFTDVYPLLSPGKGQGTMDIRIPANYMYDVKPGYTYGLDEETDQIDLENPLDLPWEDKENLIHCACPRPGSLARPSDHGG